MKSLCFSTEEMNRFVSELYNHPCCKVSFSEELDTDVIEWYDATLSKIEKITKLEDIIPLMNEKFHISIQTYDVMDLGELGIGFVFFF
jgi:hypothetical protein